MRKILLAASLVIGATNLAMANETSSDEWEWETIFGQQGQSVCFFEAQ